MKRSERIAAVITSLGGLMVMYYAWTILNLGNIHMPDAGFLPFICGAGLTALGILWTVTLQATEDRESGEQTEKRLWYRPYASLALILLYAWAMEAVGYITSTLIFMVAWQQVIEREKWVRTIAIALLGTAAMFALFRLFLKVPVPQELFLR